MPQVNFYLKKPVVSTGRSLIFLKFRYNKQKLIFSFNQTIEPINFNKNKQRIKSNSYITSDGKHYMNDLLDNLERVCISTYNMEMRNGIPTPAILKMALQNFLNRNTDDAKEKAAIPTLYELIERFIAGEIKFRGRDKSPSTLKAYKTSLASLKDFERKEKYPVNYETITLEMYYKYVAYMKRKGFKQNTIAKRIRSLKVYLGEAVDLRYTKNEQFRSKKFTAPEVEVDSVYLTEKEIIDLYNFDSSFNPCLDRVKDLFVFGCCTGLRYSDYSQIKSENIINNDGDTLLQVQTQKTDNLVVIPCNPVILEIFEKYKANHNRLPRAITGQRFNDYIKQICKLVPGFEQKGRLLSEPDKPLYACITSHTARRSAITNWHLSGFSTIDLMSISGHKTTAAFLRYIKTTKVQVAKRLQNHITKNWTPNLLKAI